MRKRLEKREVGRGRKERKEGAERERKKERKKFVVVGHAVLSIR